MADLLAKMPRVLESRKYFYYNTDNPGYLQINERKYLKPVEYILPVKFKLMK